MMDLQDRLRAYFEAESSTTRTTDPGEVMERGETMRRRRRMMAATLPAAAVLIVVVAVALIEPGGPGETEIPEVDAAAAADAQLSIHQADVDWEVQPATLGFQQQNVSADGVLYALSTAPGVRFEDFPNGRLPQAIYTSTDGVDWTGHPVGGAWVSSLAAADGLLYTVGTAPGAEEGSTSLRIEVSGDGGESFQGTQLPLDMDGHTSVTARVAATGQGVLAMATGRTSHDIVSLLPPGALEGDVNPVQTDRGIAVFELGDADLAYELCFGGDREDCDDLVEREAVRFFSWEELGLDPDGMVGGQDITHAAYWSRDGSQFEQIEYPFEGGPVRQVFSLGERAVVEVGEPGASRLLVSDDARTWRPLEGLPAFGWVSAMGQVGGEPVIVSQPAGGTGVSVLHAPDLSGPWEEISLQDLLGAPADGGNLWMSAATVGEEGVAISLAIEQRDPGGANNPLRAIVDRITPEGEPAPVRGPSMVGVLLVSEDLASWSATPTEEMGSVVDSLLMAPDGRVIAHASVPGEDGSPVRRQYLAQP